MIQGNRLHITHDSTTVRNGWAAWGRPNWICFPSGFWSGQFCRAIVSLMTTTGGALGHPDPKAAALAAGEHAMLGRILEPRLAK